MASLIEDLINTLKEQLVNYEELLILSEEKRATVIRNDIETLQKLTAAENTIIGRNQRLETKREECVKNIAIVLNTNYKELTITKIAELIKNQQEYNELIKVKEDLKETLKSLKAKNDINKTLIESSLDYIEFSVNIMRSDITKDSSYYSKNGEVLQEGKNFFDAKQ